MWQFEREAKIIGRIADAMIAVGVLIMVVCVILALCTSARGADCLPPARDCLPDARDCAPSGHLGIGNSRSPKWPAVRDAWIKQHPTCAACGTEEHVEAHHIQPIHLGGAELDQKNLITLCRTHHLSIGHLGAWAKENPKVREMAAAELQKHPQTTPAILTGPAVGPAVATPRPAGESPTGSAAGEWVWVRVGVFRGEWQWQPTQAAQGPASKDAQPAQACPSGKCPYQGSDTAPVQACAT